MGSDPKCLKVTPQTQQIKQDFFIAILLNLPYPNKVNCFSFQIVCALFKLLDGIMQPIYLDYNATTPIDPEVAEAMLPYLKEHYGNPSSSHWFGAQTKKAIEKARRQLAELLNCAVDEVIFTSGGSESNNYAIKGYALENRNKGKHIITTAIEHPAVLEVCKHLEEHGFNVTYLPVDEFGQVDVGDVERAITPQTILISVMHANNEVGTIQPITEIAKIAHERGIAVHTDAAQSVGKIPTRVDELDVDLLSVAGHKFYAPKGIGALYMRRGIELEKLIHGADHEQNRRAGTENVLEIVGLGAASVIANRNLDQNMQHMRQMRDRLYDGLTAKLNDIRLNGHPKQRLPNTLSLSFYNIEADTILSELEEIAASAGAACHSDQVEMSHVLEAMKVPVDWAMGTVRFSTGPMTTEAEIDRAVEIVSATIKRLRPETESAVPILGEVGDVKLTHFTHGLGCACKLRPQALEKVLAQLPRPTDSKVLVGSDTSDDAAVYLLSDQIAIVQTVDFFTPIVDDPYHFGAIAATNSLSDIYAMGGKPLFGLNIVGFPSNRLSIKVLQRILQGAQDKAVEAGISIIGGHTVDDTEPKYGLAVTGTINPDKILKNSGAKPGDAIILTKPIGLGIVSTAIKRGIAEQNTIDLAIQIMSALNKSAAEVMVKFPVSACTDVTGFGLLGHLKEMVEASGLGAELWHQEVPVISEAWQFAAGGLIPGGTLSNLDFVAKIMDWDESVPKTTRAILADAQTSGGLLIAVPENYKEELLADLHLHNVSEAACIGRFTDKGVGMIYVR